MATDTTAPQSRTVDEYQSPISSYQLLLRLRIENRPGNLGKVTTAIGNTGGDIGVIDIQEAGTDVVVRDLRVFCRDEAHARQIVASVTEIQGVELEHASDRTFQLHQRGKIQVENKVHIRTMAELSHVYTPGVARVSMQIHDNPDAVWALTMKANTIAVVTDGTAVLGLGDIGPEAALPVMEGKSMLFKSFGSIDAWPICLNTKDPEEIITVVKAIAPGFGGILLEDISAPRCFEIEDRLRQELDIPVFHDDQHGTAVVVLARAHQQPQDRPQAPGRPEGRADRRRRSRRRLHQDHAQLRRAQRDRASTARERSTAVATISTRPRSGSPSTPTSRVSTAR